jgi:hypothetical protein
MPSDGVAAVSSTACTRRSDASQSAIQSRGVNESQSRTFIAVRLGLGKVSPETVQQQILEACAQQPR